MCVAVVSWFIYLPGYNQFRFAASTTTDVSWGDFGDCWEKNKSCQVTKTRRATTVAGLRWSALTNTRMCMALFPEVRNGMIKGSKASVHRNEIYQGNCYSIVTYFPFNKAHLLWDKTEQWFSSTLRGRGSGGWEKDRGSGSNAWVAVY